LRCGVPAYANGGPRINPFPFSSGVWIAGTKIEAYTLVNVCQMSV
jgi:hypothetical protein